MKRYKRIYILLGVLCAACVVTFAVSRYEARKEQIESGEAVVWELDTDAVESLSWEYEGQTLSFHKEDSWSYDEDAAFPVDEEKIHALLEQFQAFGVSFTITDPEDLSQYGLDDPVCTISIGTADETYTVLLGDFSTMDSQRYVSIGDGNVYLAQSDPLDAFDAELSDLIQNDEIPSLDQVSEIVFSGTENYTITYEEDSTDTYREEDVYFTQQNGAHGPLDTDRVEDYLYTLEYLDLTDYVTYDASEEDLAAYGRELGAITLDRILVPAGEDRESARQSAAALFSQLNSAADQAATFSELAAAGGDTAGPRTLQPGDGSLDETLWEAAEALEEGQISGILESEEGFSILRRLPLDTAALLDDCFDHQLETAAQSADISVTPAYETLGPAAFYDALRQVRQQGAAA